MYVSINYRLGPFGSPQGDEAAQRGLLNLGLKDQLVALQRVQDHISTFGGDPNKASQISYLGRSLIDQHLAGHRLWASSGAISIADLYLKPGLENLVRGAVRFSP